MQHYRINKVAKKGGSILKRKDILARHTNEAVQVAAADPDCPVCEVWHDGEKVGSVG